MGKNEGFLISIITVCFNSEATIKDTFESILTGGTQTLKKHSPTIIFEISDDLLIAQKTISKEVFNILKGLNYEVNDISGNKPTPFNVNIKAKQKIKRN